MANCNTVVNQDEIIFFYKHLNSPSVRVHQYPSDIRQLSARYPQCCSIQRSVRHPPGIRQFIHQSPSCICKLSARCPQCFADPWNHPQYSHPHPQISTRHPRITSRSVDYGANIRPSICRHTLLLDSKAVLLIEILSTCQGSILSELFQICP